MPVTDGDLLRVVVSWDLPELVVGQNVFYWQLDDGVPDSPSNVQILTALDSKLTNMYETIDDILSTDVLIDEFIVERIEWAVDVWETVENVGGAPLAVAGLDTTDMVPHGVAAVLSALTSRPKTRARKFIPGFAENAVEESTWSGAALTALAAFGTAWMNAQTVVGAAELVPAVASQSGPTAGTIFLLTAAVISAIAGYQRRRKPGVGA